MYIRILKFTMECCQIFVILLVFYVILLIGKKCNSGYNKYRDKNCIRIKEVCYENTLFFTGIITALQQFIAG